MFRIVGMFFASLLETRPPTSGNALTSMDSMRIHPLPFLAGSSTAGHSPLGSTRIVSPRRAMLIARCKLSPRRTVIRRPLVRCSVVSTEARGNSGSSASLVLGSLTSDSGWSDFSARTDASAPWAATRAWLCRQVFDAALKDESHE